MPGASHSRSSGSVHPSSPSYMALGIFPEDQIQVLQRELGSPLSSLSLGASRCHCILANPQESERGLHVHTEGNRLGGYSLRAGIILVSSASGTKLNQ